MGKIFILFYILSLAIETYALAPRKYDTTKLEQNIVVEKLFRNKSFIKACTDLYKSFARIAENLEDTDNLKGIITPAKTDQDFPSWLKHLFMDSVQYFLSFSDETHYMYNTPESINSFYSDIQNHLNSVYIKLNLLWSMLTNLDNLNQHINKYSQPDAEEIEINHASLLIYFATIYLKISPNRKKNIRYLHKNILRINKAYDTIYSYFKFQDNNFYLQEHQAESSA